MILVSACLAGIKCRYDGQSNDCSVVIELVKSGKAIPVCPEQTGGLTTPRHAAERIKDKIITDNGEDVTSQFFGGAQECLKIAKLVGCKKAILKSKSPSCGFGKIYDGSFSKSLIEGNGVFAELLSENGIEVKNENNFK